MQFKKDPNMRYVDMCIFIDGHMGQLNDPDCPEEIQNTIYNYLWLLVKALSIKKRLFSKFEDYDGYSFYAANRLFLAIKNNLKNQGQVIKGKEVRPIKSCLNYTKTLLYPMKVDYLRDEKNIDNKSQKMIQEFDDIRHRQQLRDEAWIKQGSYEIFRIQLREFIKDFNITVDKVLRRAPFPAGSLDYKKLKISILLNVLYNLNHGKGIGAEPITVIVWKLPKSTANYVKLFLKELGTTMLQSIVEYHDALELDDNILSYMITNPDGEFIDNEKSKH